MPAAHTPPLPGLNRDEEVDTVINWGLGADSTAYLARMLTDPAAHGIDLERTAVLYMATGSKWPETRLLVEEFMLPLLREHGVRLVQLSRSGQLKAAGITGLDDSRSPQRLFTRGPWTLWDELESVGTVPQQAGTRKCSLRAKGEVGDRWLIPVMGGRPFRQIMGFNADEPGRCFGDARPPQRFPGAPGLPARRLGLAPPAVRGLPASAVRRALAEVVLHLLLLPRLHGLAARPPRAHARPPRNRR
ncbi:hypothetical protein ABTZ58_39660 [Streptomyces sp. NPDC094143]|uniref:hypothetical protein n=1 Tax=Streptomyces sp. NPDC094143 TaxID=3155310 RepID=UPI0033244D22